MSDIQVNKVAFIGVDQCYAKVLNKEKAAKGRRKGRQWKKAALLWGDEVLVRSINGSKVEVSAKGHRLEVKKNQLTTKGILSIWQIDCGQGDAALIRFPDRRFAAVDLGPPRKGMINSNSARTAEDFLKWVAFQDHNWMFEGEAEDDTFHLDWLAFTHPDEDHIGAGREFVKRLGTYWSVGTVYHCGLGRFKGKSPTPFEPAQGTGQRKKGFSQLGEVDGPHENELYLSTLVDGWSDVNRYSKTTQSRPWELGGNWAKILKKMYEHRSDAVKKLQRLSHLSNGSALGHGGVKVKVLGPIEDTLPGSNTEALRYLDENKTSGWYNLGSPSLSRNGHSLVLRFDYGGVRILITGDLNFKSQALLMKHWNDSVFKCHVAKACHHGSDDVSWKFLKAMSPMATVFSSGDQETHVHPRALILGLSGGFAPLLRRKDGNSFVKRSFAGYSEHNLFTPLLYSTELSRSARLRSDLKTYSKTRNAAGEHEYEKVDGVHFKGDRAGDDYLPNNKVWIVDHMTYGLVNVRTDGETIMMAVLEEGDPKKPEFHIEKFKPSELVPLP